MGSHLAAGLAAALVMLAACGSPASSPGTSIPAGAATTAPPPSSLAAPVPTSRPVPPPTTAAPPAAAWPSWARNGVAPAVPGSLAPAGDALPAGDWVEAALADDLGIVYVTWSDAAPVWRLVAAPAGDAAWRDQRGGDMNVLGVFRASTGEVLVVEPIRSADRNSAAGFIVHAYDQATATMRRAATFGDQSFATAAATQLDERRLGLWGWDRDGEVFGDLRVVVYDWQARRAEVDVVLDDVNLDSGAPAEVPYVGRLGPAVVWDHARNRAIVVHADREAVTTVSYPDGAVATRKLTESRSLLEALLGWFVPPALAKGLPASSRSAIIVGDHLHVAGTATEFWEEGGQFRYRTAATGIFSVDVDSLEIVARSEVPVDTVAAAGSRLLAHGVTSAGGAGEITTITDETASGLVVLDAATLDVIAVHDLPGSYYEVVAAGDHAYVSTQGRTYSYHARTGALVELEPGLVLNPYLAEAGLRYVPPPGG